MKSRTVLAAALLSAALLSVAGCAQFGAGLGVIAQAIPRPVDAAYKGLAGQQTIVLVWADRGVRLDNPLLQEDVAAAVQDKLINVQRDESPDALKGTTFPVSTATVIKYEDDHPETEFESAVDQAAKFNGSRVIYVEVTDFATHSEASLELFRGSMSGRLSVVETKDDGHGKVTAKVAYDGGPVQIVFPKDSPKDGLPNRRESEVAEKTINAFAEDVAKRFYKHDEDRD